MPDLLALVAVGDLTRLLWPFLALLLAVGAGFAIAFVWHRSDEFALAAALATSAALVVAIALRPAITPSRDEGPSLRVAAAIEVSTAEQVQR